MLNMFKIFISKSAETLKSNQAKKVAKDSIMHFATGFTAGYAGHLRSVKLAEAHNKNSKKVELTPP